MFVLSLPCRIRKDNVGIKFTNLPGGILFVLDQLRQNPHQASGLSRKDAEQGLMKDGDDDHLGSFLKGLTVRQLRREDVETGRSDRERERETCRKKMGVV